jgi:hypothetical protein
MSSGYPHGLRIGSTEITEDSITVDTVNATTLNGTLVPDLVVDADGDGAVVIQTSTVFITKVEAAALTLAAPTVDDDDGVEIWVIDTSGAAHTLTVAPGYNAEGTAGDIGTFGGAVGDGIGLRAFQGEWYVIPGSNLNVTITGSV